MEAPPADPDGLRFWCRAHVVILWLLAVYPLLVNRCHRVADTVYVAVALFLYVHWWFLTNECLVSLMERRAVEPTYRRGECPRTSPFRTYYRNTSWFPILCSLNPFALLWVLWRLLPHWGLPSCLSALLVVLASLVYGYLLLPEDPPECQRLRRRTEMWMKDS